MRQLISFRQPKQGESPWDHDGAYIQVFKRHHGVEVAYFGPRILGTQWVVYVRRRSDWAMGPRPWDGERRWIFGLYRYIRKNMAIYEYEEPMMGDVSIWSLGGY
jgi:hypothetical protein